MTTQSLVNSQPLVSLASQQTVSVTDELLTATPVVGEATAAVSVQTLPINMGKLSSFQQSNQVANQSIIRINIHK